MSTSITVQNESGQVVSFDTSGPKGQAVAGILEQRVARGELTKATAGKASARGRRAGRVVVVDEHTGLRDEKGDLLRSIHGGGIDPDAQGDAIGHPSGSEPVAGAVEVNSVSAAAVAQAAQPPQSKAAKAAEKALAEHQG